MQIIWINFLSKNKSKIGKKERRGLWCNTYTSRILYTHTYINIYIYNLIDMVKI